jgi:hypothetical protein
MGELIILIVGSGVDLVAFIYGTFILLPFRVDPYSSYLESSTLDLRTVVDRFSYFTSCFPLFSSRGVSNAAMGGITYNCDAEWQGEQVGSPNSCMEVSTSLTSATSLTLIPC